MTLLEMVPLCNWYTLSSYYYGIVRVYCNNGWDSISYDFYYNSTEANVICHRLGYTGASSTDGILTISFSTVIDRGCNNTNSYDPTVCCCNISSILIIFATDTTRIWNSNPFPGLIQLQ